MIKLQDIQTKLADIKEQVEQKVHHPYLLNYIKTPVVDEDKLLILISIMDQLELPYIEMQNYALTTMLVQIALDTHENVSNAYTSEAEYENPKSRQLTVLAGDYFSGLYYKLLAESDDILMINALSRGIKEVNEHKISLYQKEFDGIEKLMANIKAIEGSLIYRLSHYFQANVWSEFASDLLFVKRLLNEKKQYLQAGTSILFDALKKAAFPKSENKNKDISQEQQRYLLLICDRYIEFSKGLIEKGIKQLPYLNDVLEKRISSILNQHQPMAKTYVEEG